MLENTWETLSGKYFHRLAENRRSIHQGRIHSIVGNEVLVVEFFEWVTGGPHSVGLMWLRDLVGQPHALYETSEEMQGAYGQRREEWGLNE